MKKILSILIFTLMLFSCSTQKRSANHLTAPQDPTFQYHLLKEFEKNFYTSNDKTIVELHGQIMSLLNDQVVLLNPKFFDDQARKVYDQMHDDQTLGERTGWNYGFRHAFVAQRKELSRIAIPRFWQTGKKQKVNLSTSLLFDLNTEEIIESIVLLNGKEEELEIRSFQHVLNMLFPTVIRMLGEELQWNTEDAIQRFEEIEGPLSRLLYHKFMEITRSKNRYYDPSFFTFPHYHSIEIFDLLVSSVLTSLMDAVYTYEQEDWKAVLSAGFDVQGAISKALINKVLPVLEEILFDAAIKKDFDLYVTHQLEELKELLAPIHMETRSDSQEITGSVSVGRKLSAQVELKAKYIASVTIDTKSIEVDINHDQEMITVFIPDDPIILKSVLEDYQVTNIDNSLTVACNLKNTLLGRTQKSIPERKIKKVYIHNKKRLNETSILDKALDHEQAKLFLEPMLKKIFEPGIALFHSCYGVTFYFGNEKIDLIASPCKEEIIAKEHFNN